MISIYDVPEEPTQEDIEAWEVAPPYEFEDLPTQLRVWSYVYEYQKQYRKSPTLYEITQACGFTGKSNAAGHLNRLQKKGILLRADNARREIYLSTHPAANPPMRRIMRMNELKEYGESSL